MDDMVDLATPRCSVTLSPAVLPCGIHRVFFLTTLILFLGCRPEPAHDAVTSVTEVRQVVAIGDIHADLGAAREAFQLAGGIDEQGEQVGGDLVIVQLGDMVGRSYENREVLDFIQEVREKARRAGGAVHPLVGNHEVFAAQLRYDYVHEDAYAEAQKGVEDSGISKRELARRLGTSPSQLYRLLDTANSSKSVGQMLALLHLVGREVDVVVRPRQVPSAV